jgi:hypothetical protein
MPVTLRKAADQSPPRSSSDSVSVSISVTDAAMSAENVPWFPALMCFLQYSILITFGHLRDIWAGLSGISRYKSEEGRKGLAKLLIAWESFYTRRLYHRVQDVFNRPVTGAPGTRDIHRSWRCYCLGMVTLT